MAKRNRGSRPGTTPPHDSASVRARLEVETPRTRKAEEATRPETVARWAQEAAEPRQWSWPSERRLIGTRIQRLDGPWKATGDATYSYDVNRPRNNGFLSMTPAP